MAETSHGRLVDILLVEDNPGDVRLMQEALREVRAHNHLHVVRDGAEALAFLHQVGTYTRAVRPGLILLDLNLPKKDGREVLLEVKTNPRLRCIPVIVLTTSRAEQDIVQSYDSHANCYVTKPVDWDQFIAVMQAIKDFWLTTATLPPGEESLHV
jgi:chemotaxis family two-component system response regulator Rcp1